MQVRQVLIRMEVRGVPPRDICRRGARIEVTISFRSGRELIGNSYTDTPTGGGGKAAGY